MKDKAKETDIYRHLIEANQRAFDCGYYTAAYHSLAAALDFARETQNMNQVLAIELIATEQAKKLEHFFAKNSKSAREALQNH
jgi:hypothetical protein